MSIGWIIFWIVELAIVVGLWLTHYDSQKSTSADVEMGDDFGIMLLMAAGLLIGIVGAIVFFWHHLRYT